MTQPFVRTEMIERRAPPSGHGGLGRWLRKNLFAGWISGTLTILSIVALVGLVKAATPWLLNGVWSAGSLRECRDMISGQGADAAGACWAMVRVRWNQFIFGLYPVEAYWRPTFAMALLMVALAPVLYFGQRRAGLQLTLLAAVSLAFALWGLGTTGLAFALPVLTLAGLAVLAAMTPKGLVWVTALFPFMGFWLLWGGSLWSPVGAAAGFALFGLIWSLLQARLGAVMAATCALAVAAIWWLWGQGTAAMLLAGAFPVELPEVRSDDFGGFLLAFVIGVTAIAVSLPIGILLALGRRSEMMLIRSLSIGFIEFIRGVPLITVLFAANFLLLYFLPPRSNFDLVLRVVIVVTIFASAYIAEVIRGGLAALPVGQYEAADALGLDYWQAQRLIIMPQALKISIPGIVSSFIGLFKDTTLVALVGLMDPLQGVTKIVRADTAWKGIYWEPYLFVGAIFFITCFGMSRYSMHLERRLKTDHH